MHVMLVVDRDAFARFGRMFRHLALALHANGLRVSILSDDPDLLEDLEETPIHLQPMLPLRGWTRWRFSTTLQRAIPDVPDCVHLWGTASLKHFARWTQQNEIPLLIHITGEVELQTVLRHPLLPHEVPLALAEQQLDSLPPRARLAPPGVLLPKETSDNPIRGRTIGVLWAGNCDERSGLPVLIDAVARVPLEEVDLQVAIVGDGPELNDIWKRIRDSKVTDRFSLIGGSQLWDQAIPGMDVCVVTAAQEPLRLAPLQAMAHGKLVLAAENQPAMWFVPEETCATFATGDAQALARLLRQFRDGHPNLLAIRNQEYLQSSGLYSERC